MPRRHTSELERLEGFEAFAVSRMEEWKVPGIAVSVVKGQQLLYAQGLGLRDVERGVPVTPETVFAIGSCSKAFAAASVAMLVDEGKLEWDRPVRTYLPAFRMHDPVATDLMTPRDLLCHRSGLPRHDLVWYGSSASRKELLERIQYLEPAWGFRQRYHYQNLMFMAAGYLVGEVAGATWERFVQKRIFKPLGMASSNFSVSDTQRETDYSLPYGENAGEVRAIPFRNIDAIGPAGSINSSVLDMAKWVSLHLSKGQHRGRRLVSAENLTQTHKPHIVSIPEPSAVDLSRYTELGDACYCLGWGLLPYRGHRTIRHGGGIDGFIAAVSFLPDDDYGIVILSNLNGNSLPTILLYNLIDRLLGLPEIDWNSRVRQEVDRLKDAAEKAKAEVASARVAGTHPSHALEAYAGEYCHPGYDTLSVKLEAGALRACYNSLQFEVRHHHYDVFVLSNPTVPAPILASFASDLGGKIDRLAAPLEPNLKPIVFVRRAARV